MNIKTTFFFLILTCFQNIVAQANMRLQTGQTYTVEKVFCVNRDTLFIQLAGSEQPYKVAMKDVAYLNRAIFGKLQKRKFKEKINLLSSRSDLFYKNMNLIITINVITGLSVTAYGGLCAAAILYLNASLKTVPFIIISGVGGLIPGALITYYGIQHAIDYKAFRDAKVLE